MFPRRPHDRNYKMNVYISPTNFHLSPIIFIQYKFRLPHLKILLMASIIPNPESDKVTQNLVETSASFQASKVFVVPIKTYDTSMYGPFFNGAAANVVPGITSHWGVVLEIPQLNHHALYHLIFIEWQDRSTGDIHRKVGLHSQTVDATFATEVGTEVGTTERMEDAHKIGEMLVNGFGSYHHVFWNCKKFMNCFLQILTKSDSDFYTHFQPERSKPFIPAFFLSADIKPSNAHPSELTEMLEKLDIGPMDESESDKFISYYYNQAQADPKWIAIKRKDGWNCCIA